jgi:hypothetical protein
MDIVHELAKLSPGSTKNREDGIIILYAACTAVIRIDCLQDLGHGAVKTQSEYK